MNIRRLAVGAGLGFAFTVGALAMSSAAHADTKPTVVADLPGGVVGRAVRLPEKAAPRAKATVAQVVPDKAEQDEPAEEPANPSPPPAPEDKPAPKPKPTEESTSPAAPLEDAPADDDPEPATEPRATEPTPAPTTEPVVDVPPVEAPVEAPIEVITTPPPAPEPAEPTPTPTSPVTVPAPVDDVVDVILPADDPAPLPDAEVPVQTKPWPVSLPVPVIPALPVQLPVVIGPLAVHASEPAATVGEIPGAAAAVRPEPECSDARRVIKFDRDLIRQLIDSLTAPDTSSETAKAKPGCPSKPAPMPDQPACTSTTTTNAAGSSNTHMYADTTTAYTMPALDRLERVRARSAIPTGRHLSVEPGPA